MKYPTHTEIISQEQLWHGKLLSLWMLNKRSVTYKLIKGIKLLVGVEYLPCSVI